ncbi:MAG: prepilin peptidase [Alphaproteobacteria bacterium]|nr:prepilin peptidase [Alphaproteobacteria bacterium]MBV8549624.1 prepilin peptidase [Alphaproteobacteria bacterium]
MHTLGQLMPVLMLAFAALLMIHAAYCDCLTYRLPNRHSFLLVVAYMIFAITLPGRADFFSHLLTGFLGLIVGMLLYGGGVMGAGDAKFLASVLLWVGYRDAGVMLCIMAITGGMQALYLALRYQWGRMIRSPQVVILPATLHQVRVPYGVAIAVGGLAILSMKFQQLWLE